MSYNDNNKLRVFAENASTTSDETKSGSVFTDDYWNNSQTRANGVKEGIASSKDFNTALRQSSLMATTLAEIIASRYNKKVTADLENTIDTYNTFDAYVSALAGLFNKNNLILEDEILSKHIADEQILSQHIANSQILSKHIKNKEIKLSSLNDDILTATIQGLTSGYVLNNSSSANSISINVKKSTGETSTINFTF